MSRYPCGMSGRPAKIEVGLVVPSLELGGGVPSVAAFLCDAAERTTDFQIRLVSLATAARDPLSVCVTRPSTWARGVGVDPAGKWRGRTYTRVGARFAEFEFQRYRRRRQLDDVLRGVDVIQMVCGSAAWANAVSKMGIPLAVQVATRAKVEREARHRTGTGVGRHWRNLMTSITDRLDDRGLANADALQVENPWMLEYARNIVGAGAATVVEYAPPGIDAEFFSPAADVAPVDGPYLLCVGRLADPRKNVKLLPAVLAELTRLGHRNLKLVLAGATEPDSQFWEAVERFGVASRVHVVIKPTATELRAIYRCAAAFVLPSDEEGLGIVLLEAMACGVPAVATACGGPDGVIDHGRSGFLVPCGDALGMAEHVHQILSDHTLSGGFRENGRALIEARYAQSVAAEAFFRVWRRLAGSKVA